jgi:hypothetical protein
LNLIKYISFFNFYYLFFPQKFAFVTFPIVSSIAELTFFSQFLDFISVVIALFNTEPLLQAVVIIFSKNFVFCIVISKGRSFIQFSSDILFKQSSIPVIKLFKKLINPSLVKIHFLKSAIASKNPPSESKSQSLVIGFVSLSISVNDINFL